MNIQIIKFLNQLKNASSSSCETIVINYSEPVINILSVLYKEGFIQSFTLIKTASSAPKIRIFIRYYYNKPTFKTLKFLSSPSKISYLNYNSIIRLNNKRDQFFFSTDKGILTAFDCKKFKLGGTLLFVC